MSRNANMIVLVTMAALIAACSSSATHSTGSSSSVMATTSSTSSSTSTPAPVPTKYQDLYNTLTGYLTDFAQQVSAMPGDPHGASPIAGAELLPANGNRLQGLFAPTVMQSIDLYLHSLKAIGIGGVTLGIKLPILLSQYTGSDAARYEQFYATVAQHVRAQGLKISVELGAAFCGTAYAQCNFAFPTTPSGFAAMTVQQANIVISSVHPDYLTIDAEPDTEGILTKDPSLGTPQGTSTYVSQVMSGLVPHPGTLVGAGSASWDPMSFAQAVVAQPIDYFDIHIYPIQHQDIQNAISMVQLAKQNHKPLVADEVWLYKTPSATTANGPTQSDAVYNLDNFSFFEPLDVQFFQDIGQWARKGGFLYVSGFWSTHFFAYLAWTPQLDTESADQLTAALSSLELQALQAVQPTLTGRTWGSVG